MVNIIWIIIVIAFIFIRIRFRLSRDDSKREHATQPKNVKRTPLSQAKACYQSLKKCFSIPALHFHDLRDRAVAFTCESFQIQLKYQQKMNRYILKSQAPAFMELPADLYIRYNAAAADKIRLPESDCFLTGDPEFDTRFSFKSAEENKLICLLDNRTRQVLLNTGVPGLTYYTITGSSAYFAIDVPFSSNNYVLVQVVRNCVQLYESLSRKTDLKTGIMRNAADDPVAGVRLKNLAYLVEYFPEDPAARKLLFRCLLDDDWQVCKYAYQILARAGTEHLYSLVRTNRGFRRFHPAKQWQALRLLLEHEKEKCLDTVTAFYLNTKNEIANIKLKQQILGGIMMTGSRAALDFLISQLNEFQSDLILSIINLLGEYGDSEAISSLYSLSVNTERNDQIRNAAAYAIKQIKARIGPGESGWLSVSDQEKLGGALSVPGDEKGRLSIDDTGDA